MAGAYFALVYIYERVPVGTCAIAFVFKQSDERTEIHVSHSARGQVAFLNLTGKVHELHGEVEICARTRDERGRVVSYVKAQFHCFGEEALKKNPLAHTAVEGNLFDKLKGVDYKDREVELSFVMKVEFTELEQLSDCLRRVKAKHELELTDYLLF